MSLKAILFDFNGVIINDEAIHEELIAELLIQENLRYSVGDYRSLCLGKSDRVCLRDMLERRGRIPNEVYLQQLIHKKSAAYQDRLASMEKLPIYGGLEDAIYNFRLAKLPLGIVSGALRQEVELVLERSNLRQYFSIIVTGDEISTSKPDPEGYLLGARKLGEMFPELHLQPQECLAIEDTVVGMQAAKRAGMQVVGVANTYPFHYVQRHCNWAVDYLWDLELERVQEVYAKTSSAVIG